MARLHIVVTILLFSIYAHAKLILNEMELCDPTKDYAVTFTKKLKKENDMQILEGSMTTKIDLDDNIMSFIEVFMYEDGKWNHMLDYKDTFCQNVLKHLREFSTGIEKAAGLSQTCPYPKGDYKVTNVPLDFEKVDYSVVPNGKFKANMTMTDVKTTELLACIRFEFTVEH